MIKDNNELLKLKLSKKKSNIIVFYNSISESIYALFCLVLDELLKIFGMNVLVTLLDIYILYAIYWIQM